MADEKNVKLSPPWFTVHRMAKALFGNDPQIDIRDLSDETDGQYVYIMVVNDEKKASAIKAILKNPVELGNTTVKACIYGPNENEVQDLNSLDIDVYQTAFSGNPIFEKTVLDQKGFYKIGYCVFKKEVIQFWNDDLSDYLGNYSGLASDIAREILNSDGVQFCIAGD